MTDHVEHGAVLLTWSDDDRWTGTQYVPDRWTGTQYVPGRRGDVFEDGCVRTTDFDDDGYPIETWT